MMKKAEMERLEHSSGQLSALHREIGMLSKKSPNDGVNRFKLKHINAALAPANSILGKKRLPLPDFDQFDVDDVPTNSDVTMVLAQYLEALDLYRSENIFLRSGGWAYRLADTDEVFRTSPPSSVTRSK